MEPLVVLSRQGAVARVLLNRPEALNALNAELRRALAHTVAELDLDPAVRVVILGGAGRGFCAGADLGEWPDEPVQMLIEREYRPILSAIAGSSKIWIAQVHGAAAGIGVALALNCDLLTMADDAHLVLAFSRIGLVPDGGVTWLLHRALGPRRALQVIVEGGRVSAAEAQGAGLANVIFPAAQLEAGTQELALRVGAAPPLATTAAKRLLRRADGLSFEEAILCEALEQAPLIRSRDAAEGVAAFKARRSPDFKGC